MRDNKLATCLMIFLVNIDFLQPCECVCLCSLNSERYCCSETYLDGDKEWGVKYQGRVTLEQISLRERDEKY